ncbi:putative Kinase [Quillaja saponaria]|uniref:non-specific serine/threonine protein kinase n=1 Tax=Quillaja saponaria TaxID=32244 RepID=A0AAD7P6L9_QUISA|nr:putative Kinase [Quillaja saponaria]
MTYRFLFISSILLVLILGFSSLIGDVSNSTSSELWLLDSHGEDFQGLSRRSGRNLLTLDSDQPKRSTALVAALDGTLYMVESGSMKIIWSFPTGPPIYSSYQAPDNNDKDKESVSGSNIRSIECGEDWDLYMQTEHLVKVKLPTSVAQFVSATPTLSEDGAVILGSKKTTVFEVDAKTGRVIRSYSASDSVNTSSSWADEKQSVKNSTKNKLLVKTDGVMPKTPELPLKIFRTDYSLISVGPKPEKTLWSMTVAEFQAVLYCQDAGKLSGGPPLNSEYNSGSDIGIDLAMPLPCNVRTSVYRQRNHVLLESSRSERLLGTLAEDKMRPMPASSLMLPSQPQDDSMINVDDENMMLPAPSPNSLSPLHPEVDYHDNNDSEAIVPPPPKNNKDSVKSVVQGVTTSRYDESSMFFNWFRALPLVFSVVFLLSFIIYCYPVVVRSHVLLKGETSKFDLNGLSPKRRRTRKSGKNSGSMEKKDKIVDVFANDESDKEALLNLNKVVEGAADGRRIGKLFVSNTEIAKGSNGTVVLEGIYEGRAVAVKRLVQAHHDVASKEIQNLIASDRHPNIVRWYGVEYDQDFVYLSLERCTCSLDDLIQMCSESLGNPGFINDQASGYIINSRLKLLKDIMPDLNLWEANGLPSSLLLKLMRDVVSGLVHLHELGIIHRDLKPQNVLIIKEKSLCAKLSDMGISKRLVGDMSSLGHQATGCGSSGWQAPEQLLQGRQTRSMDLFSLGCVLFFCITGGRHPFGDRLERDINIVKNRADLFLLEFFPEAEDLISHLLDPDPDLRPKALDVLHHPFFWSSEIRLSFLRDTSDRMELEDRETGSELLNALESIAPVALGGKWDEMMEMAFIINIGRYRRYKFDSVRDLLRVMRNKLNHYRELPKGIQELLGPVPEGYDDYFASRFPRLLIEVYKVVCKYCREEECFQKYFKSNVY